LPKLKIEEISQIKDKLKSFITWEEGMKHLTTKEVNFVLEAISVWSEERNISIPIDTSVPFQDYPYLYISIRKYIYLYYLCKYEFINFYVYQHKI